MAAFINLILKHRIFIHVFNASNVYDLDKLDIQNLEKLAYNRFIIKEFILNDTLVFSKVDLFTGTVDPRQLFRIQFHTSDKELVTNSDKYLDSELNDWEYFEEELKGIGQFNKRYTKHYTDKLIQYGYDIKYTVRRGVIQDTYIISVYVYRSE